MKFQGCSGRARFVPAADSTIPGGVDISKLHLSPPEIAQSFVEIGCRKASLPAGRLILLGILGGAFIALAAQGSNVAAHTIESVGIAKLLSGVIFASGLLMVVVTGAELFTGNSLIVVSCLDGKSRWISLLRNWIFVYAGNFIGAMIVTVFVFLSGQYDFSNGLLGGYTIKVALNKTNFSFSNAFFLGLLCNWLVCMAVWMAGAAPDISGKTFAVFFPVWLFVASGFEHSIANMYYIPAGILAKTNGAWTDAAVSLGADLAKIEALNWGSFFVKNLFPVTLGNIAGGSLFVGGVYWLSFLYKGRSRKSDIEFAGDGSADKAAESR